MIGSVAATVEPETTLIERTRAGDASALESMFRRYSPMVYRVALRLSAESLDAEDVLQDVFVGLPEAIRSFDGSGSFEGWLKRVTVRTTLMKSRAKSRKHEVSLDAVLDSIEGTPEGEADRLSLEDAIAELPVALRQVFVLKEIEGYSHNEIGTLLGINAGTSEVRLFRARRLLRERLGDSR
jgi:RNA polymerase sigma-70 factor (ECF subfamily)